MIQKIKDFYQNHGWLLIIILPILFLTFHLVSKTFENYQIEKENRILEKERITLKSDILKREELIEFKDLENKLLTQQVQRRDSLIIINRIYTSEKIKSVDRDTPIELQEFFTNYQPLREDR